MSKCKKLTWSDAVLLCISSAEEVHHQLFFLREDAITDPTKFDGRTSSISYWSSVIRELRSLAIDAGIDTTVNKKTNQKQQEL